MQLITALLAGLLFGIGLIVSGMTDPAKVIGFLDLAGAWNPALAWVMAGALLVSALGFALARRRKTALLGDPFRRGMGIGRLLPRPCPRIGAHGWRQAVGVCRGHAGRNGGVRTASKSQAPLSRQHAICLHLHLSHISTIMEI